MSKVYWDLDGVLREFGTYVLGYEPSYWDAINKDGKTVIELVNERPEICLECPESKYLPIVNEYLDKITIMTNQLPSWIPFTDKWLNNHIQIQYEVIYTKNPGDKLARLKEGDILVEDFPNFPCYDNIVLIDRTYNKHVSAPLRISTISDLKKFISDMGWY